MLPNVDVRSNVRRLNRRVWPDIHVIANLHRVVSQHAPADPARRLDHAASSDDAAFADADRVAAGAAFGATILFGRESVQVAA